jgi:hypothetical protein
MPIWPALPTPFINRRLEQRDEHVELAEKIRG